MQKFSNLAGRVLIAQIFLMAGISKIGGYAGTQGYMEAMGVPGGLLPLVIVLEIGGALALIAGWQTRLISLALAGFSILSAVIFHADLADQTTMIMFMKNLAAGQSTTGVSAEWAPTSKQASRGNSCQRPRACQQPTVTA